MKKTIFTISAVVLYIIGIFALNLDISKSSDFVIIFIFTAIVAYIFTYSPFQIFWQGLLFYLTFIAVISYATLDEVDYGFWRSFKSLITPDYLFNMFWFSIFAGIALGGFLKLYVLKQKKNRE